MRRTSSAGARCDVTLSRGAGVRGRVVGWLAGWSRRIANSRIIGHSLPRHYNYWNNSGIVRLPPLPRPLHATSTIHRPPVPQPRPAYSETPWSRICMYANTTFYHARYNRLLARWDLDCFEQARAVIDKWRLPIQTWQLLVTSLNKKVIDYDTLFSTGISLETIHYANNENNTKEK